MAPSEKKLLKQSLGKDGFTQPRARGKHQITSMSDIVRDLSRLGWSDERIGTELSMDQDEVLRLKQISGLTELFQEEFSQAWTVR